MRRIRRDIYIHRYAQTTAADKKRISLTNLQVFGVSYNSDIPLLFLCFHLSVISLFSLLSRFKQHSGNTLGFICYKSNSHLIPKPSELLKIKMSHISRLDDWPGVQHSSTCPGISNLKRETVLQTEQNWERGMFPRPLLLGFVSLQGMAHCRLC